MILCSSMVQPEQYAYNHDLSFRKQENPGLVKQWKFLVLGRP